VTKTATVSLHGNLYEVDPALAGARVELVFDPFDLTDIVVRHHDRPAGRAVPFQIGRHVHPKARAETPPAPTPTGIDYLRLIEERHTSALGQQLRYAQLADPTDPRPGDRPPPDPDGLPYDTDLLMLAGADTEPGPASRAPAADLALEAELAGFAALLHHDDYDAELPAGDPEEIR